MHETVCCVGSRRTEVPRDGCNRTAQIYDTKTGQRTCVLVDEGASKTGDLYIRSVCFSPDGKYLATGADDKQIRIWDIAEKRIRNVFEGHQKEIYSLDFSRDGRLIVSGSADCTARIWDMVDGSMNKILTIDEPDSVNAGVTSVRISPDGRLVAAGSLDTIVRIWDVHVAFTPDGKGLVSGSLDKTLKYWDGGQCTMNFTGHKDNVLCVAVSHDGQWVVSGSKDRGVQFWDAKTAVVQCVLQGHKNSGGHLGVPLPALTDNEFSGLDRSKSSWEYVGYWQWGLPSANMELYRPMSLAVRLIAIYPLISSHWCMRKTKCVYEVTAKLYPHPNNPLSTATKSRARFYSLRHPVALLCVRVGACAML
ncbi:Transcriptional repressor rco-1 [Grifola frondosa]|uniref:Transcriptional repressor rco-1 n=1 Tax=Grifola frondosa TaxID=5627 RepID=A0A1C7MCR8_GRIFR|nr:Transcriptional repressor rco-1 [Grifola frondosa]